MAMSPTFYVCGSMWMLSVADFDIVELDSQILYNLIPSRFPTIRVFDRINSSRHDEIAELETLTNPREQAKRAILNNMDIVDAGNPMVQNWNHAPFAYYNPDGTHFFGPQQSSLELAYDPQTALLLALAHRERFLLRTKELPIALEMRELSRHVTGRFADLSRLGVIDDKNQRIEIGQSVVSCELDGIIFHPSERPVATCLAALHQRGFSKVDQCNHFKFLWNGSEIDRIYCFNSGKEFTPEQLRIEESLLAA